MRVMIPPLGTSSQAWRSNWVAASATIDPQLGVGGLMPNPRNARPEATTSATAATNVAWTTIGPQRRGTTCRLMMRRCGRPTTRAASM